MPKRKTLSLIGLTPLVCSLACSDDTSAPDAGTPDAAEPTDTGGGLVSDCVPYMPTSLSDGASGMWPDADTDELVLASIIAPDDPGGGYFEIDLDGYEAFDVGGVARVELRGETIASSGASDPGAPTNVAFAAAPGESYDLVAVQFLRADSFPAPVNASWQFTSLVDCWEPNDTREEASRFLLGESVEAYFFAGYTDGRAPQDGDLDDWYVVRLEEEASSVDFTVGSLPPNKSNRFRVYREGEGSPEGSVLTEDGLDFVTVTVAPAPAGDYFLHLAEFLVYDATVPKDEPLVESWTDTYTIEVQVTP